MANIGGFEAVASAIPAGHFTIFGDMPIWLMLAYTATGISILVDPGFYQRIFAAKSARQARNAMLLSMLIWFAYDWLVVAGGMLAAAGVDAGILPANLHSNDALLTAVIYVLPAGLAGLFLAGVLATANFIGFDFAKFTVAKRWFDACTSRSAFARAGKVGS